MTDFLAIRLIQFANSERMASRTVGQPDDRGLANSK